MRLYSEAAGEGPGVVLGHAGICDLRRASIAGTAHLPSLERPEEFDELVLAFLQES